VIEQTIRQKLPSGFQTSEFLLEHGMIDKIIHRKLLKASLAQFIELFCPQGVLN
jgi:acetyl-CoA carboxylase carboxyl transferase subunit beta